MDTTVLGTALATSGLMGAFVGIAVTALGVGTYELVKDREVDPNRVALLYAGMATVFFLGVPGAILSSEGRV